MQRKSKSRVLWLFSGMTVLVIAGGLLSVLAGAVEPKQTNPSGAFPTPLSSNLPFDVDVAALGKLDRDKQIPEAQRLFDIYAWQAFLALNWPATADGEPDKTKTLADAEAKRVWMGWRRNDTIFLPDGGKPDPWDAVKEMSDSRHYLWRFSKQLNERRSPENRLTDSVQAFTAPLVDQNGAFVRYESYLNRPQFEYIVQNELYNQEGQVEFVANRGKPIQFPANVTGPKPKHGSMGIKLAWKQLGPNDIPSRFFTIDATVVSTSYDKDGKPVRTQSMQKMGLVGMHITMLTQSAPNWIWTTFEHVDNVVANDLEFGTTLANKKARVRPNFNNPDAPTKLVNVRPPLNAPPGQKVLDTWDESKTTNPTQLTRVIPIPPATASLNREVQNLLREEKSVFQYYELVGAQWPVQPGFPAFGGGAGSAPESIQFKAPGRVLPVYLANTVMESFFQTGEQPAGPLEEDDRLPSGFFADSQREPVTPDRTRVFGTESCVGCHFSAGAAIGFKKDENGKYITDSKNGWRIPIFGKNGNFGQTGSAAYFWQFQMKTRPKASVVAAPPAGK